MIYVCALGTDILNLVPTASVYISEYPLLPSAYSVYNYNITVYSKHYRCTKPVEILLKEHFPLLICNMKNSYQINARTKTIVFKFHITGLI